MKIPAWINEIISAITSVLGLEPSRLVQSIIISVLLVGVLTAAVVLIFMLRSLLSRDKRFNDDSTTAKLHAVNEAIKPSSAEYLRTINDAIETALFPVFRRIKRLEDKTFPATEAQHTIVAQPHKAEALQIYDDIQDVVLPQEQEQEDVIAEASQVQDNTQQALPPAEDDEHTTVAQQESYPDHTKAA